MPQHLLRGKGLKTVDFNYHPVWTGPFRFKEWKDGGQIVLVSNNDYYEGRPYLDRILVKVYGDNRKVWTALMKGEVDFSAFIEIDDYKLAKKDPRLKTYSFLADYYYGIVYNLNDPLMSDIRIRKAITYGIDRKELIEKVASGYGVECIGPFYPGLPGFNKDLRPYEYDPKKAKELLKEAGIKDSFEFKVLFDRRIKEFKKLIMVLRQQLQQIGIRLKVIPYDSYKELTKEYLKEVKPQGHLKLLPAYFYEDIAKNWSSLKSKMEHNIWIYKNKEVDYLFSLGEGMLDTNRRNKVYQMIHSIIYEEQPGCFLYFPYVFYAISADFIGIDEFFTINMPTYTIKNWIRKKGGEIDGGYSKG